MSGAGTAARRGAGARLAGGTGAAPRRRRTGIARLARRTGLEGAGNGDRAAVDAPAGGARSATREQELAGAAAIGIVLSMFLPWWRDPVFGLSYMAFNRFGWVEFRSC